MTNRLNLSVAFLFIFSSFLINQSNAQISAGGNPWSLQESNSIASIPTKAFRGLSHAALTALSEQEETEGLPPRFGELRTANANLSNSGQWTNLENGDRVWHLKIKSSGATSINLLYNDFYLPEGGKFFVYGWNTKKVLGAFTNYNNKEDGIFATGLIYDDEVVLEYYEPLRVVNQGRISVDKVVHGFKYININTFERGYNDSGNCNVNVNCPDGDDWQNEKKSVALLLVNGFRFCTGFLLNNTAQDCRPLFMTANHCSDPYDAVNNPNATNWTFLWNYESPECNNVDGETNQTTVGATLIANPGNTGSVFRSDFALFELMENPKDAGYDVYFSGFDATSTPAIGAVGLHHPRGDIKKICFENDQTSFTSYGGNVNSGTTHVRVGDWDLGTTEPGSSGSPIYDPITKRTIGILSGGGAACGNNLPDWYGAIAHAWSNQGNINPLRRIGVHLDPVGAGSELSMNGSADPCGSAVPTCDDGIQNGDETDIDCGGPDCPACPTCDDGIQNGDETDIDCGGPDCQDCPTCDDGIQNGDETGVDCGGSECLPCCELEIIELIIIDTRCGDPNGSVEVFTTGGFELVEYSLDGILYQEDNFFEDLVPESYIIYAKDFNNCEVEMEFVIEESFEITIEVIPVEPSCSMDNGSIEVLVANASDPLFAINNGPFQESNFFENLPSGDYKIDVIDENECTAFFELTLAGDFNIMLSNVTEPATCNESNGSITINAEGGQAPYQYSINNGPLGDVNVFSNLEANTYTIKVVDQNDCSFEEMIIVENTNTLIATASAEGTVCGLKNGTIVIEVNQGLAPYSFSLDNINFDVNPVFENLSIANYTAYIKDANGCMMAIQDLIIQESEAVNLTVEGTSVRCFGESNGKIEANGISGVSPFRYSLDGINFNESNIFENLPAGDYNVFAMDAVNCSASFPINVSEPDEIMLTLRLEAGKLIAEVVGGTTPYKYLWSDGSDNSSIENPTESRYTLLVTDENDCIIEGEINDIVSSNQNLFNSNQLEIYPNPAIDHLVLKASIPINGDFILEVFNITGKRVYKQYLQNLDKLLIPTSSWNSGSYILKVKGKSAISIAKFIVQ